MVASLSVCFVSHSQMVITLHPTAVSSAKCSASLAVLAANFSSQNAVLDFGTDALEQPG